MIVKQRDAQLSTIQALEASARHTHDKIKRAACLGAAARLRDDATTEFAVNLVNRHFAASEEWAVIHDLRLSVGGHAVHLNHVLISSSLAIITLDTRLLDQSVLVSDRGQCFIVRNKIKKPIASPLAKMGKDLRKLNSLVTDLNIFPKRFGLANKVESRGFVLTSVNLRVPSKSSYAQSNVSIQCGESLFATLWKRDLRSSKVLGSCVTPELLYEIAAKIAYQHRPIYSQALLLSESSASDQTQTLSAAC